MSQPLVSVIIPTHNRASLLREALTSVFQQEGRGTRFELEAIVVDDASTDDTAAALSQFPEARYVRLSEPRGVSTAHNVGIRASSGRYVGLLDDDDLLLPHKLRVQVPVLEADGGLDVVYSQVLQRNRGGSTRDVVLPDPRYATYGWPLQQFLTKGQYTVFHLLGALVRREAFDRAGYYDESLRLHVDTDLWMRLAHRGRFSFLPGVVGIWRPGVGGLTSEAALSLERTHRDVQERFLARLSHAEVDEATRRDARARLSAKWLPHLAAHGQLGRLRECLQEALSTSPQLFEDPATRGVIVGAALRLARGHEDPLAAVQALCGDLQALARRHGRTAREVNPFVAVIWAVTARGLGARPRPRPGLAASAAVQSLRYDPRQARRVRLARVAARGLLRHPYTFLASLGRRMAPPPQRASDNRP